jgi:FkbM family methyltransferase
MWLVFPEARTIEAPSHVLMTRRWGKVWDIGCNFGFYSMAAARAGNEVVAFDMSPHVLAMMNRSCTINGVSVTTVARAVTPRPRTYDAPQTSACTNQCIAGTGSSQSLTYLEAEKAYGTPAFIKMDIEGGERDFLESEMFQSWLQDNRITMLVEVHHGYLIGPNAFPRMARLQVDHDHVLLEPRNVAEDESCEHVGRCQA